MKKIFFLILFLFLTANLLEGAGAGVEVRASREGLIKTEPNTIVTVPIRITNQMPSTIEFTTRAAVPKGWKLITPEVPFSLGIGESDIRLLSFQVPRGAIAGRYRVTWTVAGRRYRSVHGSDTVDVAVLPITDLQAELLEAPECVIAGESYEAVFLVTSNSNATNVISISIRSEPELKVCTDSDKFTLLTGQKKEVVVRVKTDRKVKKPVIHRIEFLAEVAGEEKARALAVSSVEVIPRVTDGDGRYLKIPGNVALRYLSQRSGRNISGIQAEGLWQGTLDRNRTKHIALLLRGPTVGETSILGRREEYRLSFATRSYELDLGDDVYSLSPLTESKYGRGFRARLVVASLGLSGYYSRNPQGTQEDRRASAQATVSLAQKHSVGIGFLQRKIQSAEDEFLSLSADLTPVSCANVQAEYAASVTRDQTHEKGGNAYSLTANVHPHRVSLWARCIHAAKDYVGQYRDTDVLSGNLTAPLGKGLKFYAGIQRGTSNLDLDTSLVLAPLNQYRQVGLRYALRPSSNLFLEYKNITQEDRLDEPQFDYEEDTYTMGGGQGFGKVDINGSFELGRSTDNLTPQNSNLRRYMISSCLRPVRNQVFTAFLRCTDKTIPGGEKTRQICAGLKSSLRIGSTTSLELRLQTDDLREPYYGDRDRFSTELTHVLPNRNTISFQGIYTSDRSTNENDDIAFVAEYAVPFGVPIGTARTVGTVKGLVYNKDTKRPMANMILRINGSTAVTDAKGYFIFPVLEVGRYLLDIDRRESGVDMLVAGKTPVEIAVEADKETLVNIAMTRRASLTGRVIAYHSEDAERNASPVRPGDGEDYFIVGEGRAQPGLARAYPLSNVLVELKNATGRQKRVTDSRGYFRFEDVCPGTWTLKVDERNLPEYYYIEKESFTFVLEPGEKKEIVVKALPKMRRVNIIQKSRTVLREMKR
jgi:hypothetical protein